MTTILQRAMPERRPPLEAQGHSLAELARAIEQRGGPPPVDQWNPSHCGDSEMRIARDGTWFHQGSPIGRPAMVRLFSTVLRREPDGSHVLVTPVEKLTIEVESTAFRATQMTMAGDRRAAPHRPDPRQRRRIDRRPRAPADRDRHARWPQSPRRRPLRAGGRARPARSIMNSPTSPSPRAMTRRASGPTAPSFR